MDDKIQKELKEVQKKLDDIEKKQEMLHKIQELDREHSKKMASRPINHSYEMM
jgi:tetrahydromethanopterin S-methyltransferase subunit G